MKIPQETIRLLTLASSAYTNEHRSDVVSPPKARLPHLPNHIERHLQSHSSSPHLTADTTRLLQASSSTSACDSSFLSCLLSSTCRSCFSTMQENDVDWANVVPDTPCQDVLGFLAASGHCLDVRNGGDDEQDIFCSAFDACVVWDEEEQEANGPSGAAEGYDVQAMDCSTLAECDWDGIHEHFLGDGICHDSLPGCYNSKACDYDGGDCCEDTCKPPGGTGSLAVTYGECGQEGYACRDPASDKCMPSLARLYEEFCETEKKKEEGDKQIEFDDDALFGEEEEVTCSSGTMGYRLVQYDSWGDGWDNTIMTLSEKDSTGTPVYSGGLKYGSQGTEYLCIPKDPKCYHVEVMNGVWGNEISWELRPMAGGAPSLAAGGSPTDCTVPLGGALPSCENTCDKTRPDTSINDPNYMSYKDMEACLEKKCLIQAGVCTQDESCVSCMSDETPEYCFANENFNALIDCSMCSCTEDRPSYCDAKASSASTSGSNGSSAASHDGKVKPAASGTATAGSATAGTASCGPEQTIKGTQALIKFSDCADLDQMMAMVTEFDNNNFGMLDLFEECAHTYGDEVLHGGKSALGCMTILHSIIFDEEHNEKTAMAKGANGEALNEKVSLAISTLAHHLYTDGESFCNCASDVNKATPTCNSFINFKTLMYEAVDACESLDAIDCAAWEEFYTPCKKNLMQMFDKVDFDNQEQCTYVQEMCGGAGPFPSFRRLDCGGEIAKPAWDFHTMYSRGCLKSSAGAPPSPTVPAGTTPVVPQTPKKAAPAPASKPNPHFEPYTPSNADAPKPYKPFYSPSDSEPEDDKSYKSDKTTHHFRNFSIVLVISCIAGFVYIKKRRENFNYYRFRQMRANRNYGQGLNDGGGDYAGVAMADSCSFEPPTLPPTPNAMI